MKDSRVAFRVLSLLHSASFDRAVSTLGDHLSVLKLVTVLEDLGKSFSPSS